MNLNKEKIVLVVSVLMLVFAVWQVKSSVRDPIELPEIPPVSADVPSPDVDLGVARLFEDGEIGRIIGAGGDALRNPWRRYEGLVEPNAALIPVPKPQPEVPVFLNLPLSNAISETRRRPSSFSLSDIMRVKVLDKPEEESKEKETNE
jgi:hypothetical protein